MGYACPICDVPQRDGKHLANHMAFTAMLRHEDHETWLDDHVDGWSEMNAAELSDLVVDHAEERDFDEIFEDTADGHSHPHDHAHGHGSPAIRQGGNLDAEAQQILREAQELTQRMATDEGATSNSADENDEGDETTEE